jgi:alkyl hydroperoxide reductase subunit F
MAKRKADMKKLIDDKTKKELLPIMEALIDPVKIIFFSRKKDCPTCKQELSLLKELSALSDKLELKTFDLVLNGDEALKYKIDKVPATVIMGEEDYGIRFFGMTTGYEFTSLLEAIVMVSLGKSGLEPEIEALVRTIKEPVHLQVMTTLTCPYCPKMVHAAHQFAFINENIRSDMVESAEFPHLIKKYDVVGVPKTIINEVHSFEGAVPPPAAFMKILEAVNPEEFRKLDEAIRELQGSRMAKPAEEGYEYEVLIVGGGPAALSAALYTTRKGLDTALIANRFGGQITYTATIENYLGFPQIGGQDMTTLFRNHMENYQVAEVLGINVTSVSKGDKGFVITTEDGKKYNARSMIYCAGKEYRKLGVPGEERFIGKSIGFCATCDAPLYSGKKVAIVGGGNSAFTSARDLLHYALEIHMVHRRNEFRADEELVKEIIDAENVMIHSPMEVESFLGEEKLTGVRLRSSDDKEKKDIEVDGVFLEIGLTPNTNPVKDIIKLNEWGEVPIEKDQSTDIPGFFAAGDVTDVSEKQISIAVGDGAKAALAAYKYLVENKLTQSTVGTKESWQ